MEATPGNDPWRGGAAYERYMGRWSRRLAPSFVQWLAAPPAMRWLDVGCGTGALAATIVERMAPSALFGIEPSEGFLASARAELGTQAMLLCATADRIPLADGTVDLAVSALVLNFVPDTAAALREMARVSASGGTVAACVWDYAQKMDLIRHYWDAAAEVGALAAGTDEGERFPLCRPDALAAAFGAAGLASVTVAPLEIETRFADFDDYWLPFLGGQGPAPAHAMGLDETTRERLRRRLRERLPVAGDGSITLGARAWAARGRC